MSLRYGIVSIRKTPAEPCGRDRPNASSGLRGRNTVNLVRTGM